MKIAVVGAGAAGLRTAMLLEQEGADVTVYEARDRLGGRIHTNCQDGACYEAGGEWIDSDQRRVIELVQELSKELEQPGFWPGLVIYKGERSTEDLLWTDALEDELRLEAAAREACRNLVTPPWKNRQHAELERHTLAGFINEHARSERGRWWLTAKYRSDEGDDPERIGLLGWLSGYLHYVDRDPDAMSAYRIRGGAQGLCESMATRLRTEVRTGEELVRVIEDGVVRLRLSSGEEVFDRAVLTLPPRALEKVAFDPPLSGPKRCALEASGMSSAIKVCMAFSRAWWNDEGWNGRMLSDTRLQQTWDGTMGETPVLSAYICGATAIELLQTMDPVREALQELERLFPGAAEHFVSGWVHDWIGDPFARGAFSHLAPGYVLNHMEHVATPHGLVHFAGEHTAIYTGFIEGALQSAERVLQEVRNA